MPHYDVIKSFTVTEVAEHIYAETEAQALAIATDGDHTWKRYESDYERVDGDICYIVDKGTLRMTDAQLESLKQIYQWHDVHKRQDLELHEFIRSAHRAVGADRTIFVQVGRFWIGVEPDGSRHS